MQVALKSIDVSEEYKDASFRILLTSNGKMFDDIIGLKLILFPDCRLTTSEHLIECRLSPHEARRLGELLLASAERCTTEFSKPARKRYK